MFAALVFSLLIPILIIYCYKNAYKRPKNFPPGPPSLPVYGAYWIILAYGLNNISLGCRRLGEKYKTKILGCALGPVIGIIINDAALIKEMFNREEFDGRLDVIIFRLRSYWKKLGIFFTDGYFWHIQRRFSLRFLRESGFGRRSEILETVIENEIKDMLDMRFNGPKYPIEKEIVNGDLVNIPDFFTIPFMNGFMQVLSRSTLPRSEYIELWTAARRMLIFQRSSNDLGGALSLTPWLKDILPSYSGYNGLVTGSEYMLKFFEKLIKEAIDTHDVTYDRHFIDTYLTKMKQEMSEAERTTFSVDQLVLTATDFMTAAATTIQAPMSMLIERLLLQPDIQDRIHEEIDRVVGRDRFPTLDDRPKMPYVESCIREIMRFETVLPLGVGHRAMKDTTIGGYDIPENSFVSANLTALHMDKETWGDPENFRPERLIKNGRFDPASDKSLPFGAGRRLCAGETYARQSMFQVFASLMQAFKISTADGKPLLKPAKRIPGIVVTVPEFWVRLTPRT